MDQYIDLIIFALLPFLIAGNVPRVSASGYGWSALLETATTNYAEQRAIVSEVTQGFG